MQDDVSAIRAVVRDWIDASKRGDRAALQDLMTDDMVFLVPGRVFGKAEFLGTGQQKGPRLIDAEHQIDEIEVNGTMAWMRCRLSVTIEFPDRSEAVRRSGATLTILSKDAAGRWRLARDANLLN